MQIYIYFHFCMMKRMLTHQRNTNRRISIFQSYKGSRVSYMCLKTNTCIANQSTQGHLIRRIGHKPTGVRFLMFNKCEVRALVYNNSLSPMCSLFPPFFVRSNLAVSCSPRGSYFDNWDMCSCFLRPRKTESPISQSTTHNNRKASDT